MSSYLNDLMFCRVIPVLLLVEGGYVNDPQDPGGETNYGISKRAYPSLDIANLTAEQAAQIYWTDYWLKGQCPSIPYPLCCYFFDACVNQGLGEATKILQQTAGVPSDGVIGPVTLEAVLKLPPANHYLYLVNRLSYYRGLPGWARFGGGWMNRLLRIAAL